MLKKIQDGNYVKYLDLVIWHNYVKFLIPEIAACYTYFENDSLNMALKFLSYTGLKYDYIKPVENFFGLDDSDCLYQKAMLDKNIQTGLYTKSGLYRIEEKNKKVEIKTKAKQVFDFDEPKFTSWDITKIPAKENLWRLVV